VEPIDEGQCVILISPFSIEDDASVLLSREAMFFCAQFSGARQFGCGDAALWY
jgi:hypothetical protein